MSGKFVVGVIFCVFTITVTSLVGSGEVRALSYIALGDSFTSGEGENSDDFYQFLDNPLSGMCHLSTRSYPYVAAEQVTNNHLSVHSVACSGARTTDIVGGDDYFGQGARLITGLEPLGFEQISEIQLDALHSFRPGLTRQMVFIDRYRPDIVSVGIGGNDIGMVDKLKSCMMPETCEWAVSGNWDERAMAGREIKSLFETLVSVYRYLRSRTPASLFFAVGYPKLINPDGLCSVSLATMFDSSEKQFMNQAIHYLNNVVRSAAQASGFSFVSEEDAFNGNALCDITNTPAMNAIRFGDDIAPISTIGKFKLFGNESFHPTPFGHFLLSKAVAAVLDKGIEQNLAPQDDNLQIHAPEPSEYWHDNDRSLPRSVSVGDMTSDSDTENQLILRLPAYSFQPESQVKVLVHSEVRELNIVNANADGSISLKLFLPDNLPSGFHRLVAKGIDSEGNQVEYYKVFSHDAQTNPVQVPTATPSTLPPSSGEQHFESSPSNPVQLGTQTFFPDHVPAVLGLKDKHHNVILLWIGVGLVLMGVVGILYKLRKWT